MTKRALRLELGVFSWDDPRFRPHLRAVYMQECQNDECRPRRWARGPWRLVYGLADSEGVEAPPKPGHEPVAPEWLHNDSRDPAGA